MLKVNEDLLQFIWRYKLVGPRELVTVSGNKITVLNTGELNKDSGPDFFNAKIKTGTITLAGNIEIHVRSSDWDKHKHSGDAAYSNVILHVVYKNDRKKNINNIEVLELEKYIDKTILKKYSELIHSKNSLPCSKQITGINPLQLNAWLERMLIERLENKTKSITHLFNLSGHDFATTFYLTLARNFGFKTNAEPFETLARHLPLKLLLKHSDNLFQLEALLFGTAGLLNKSYKEKYLQQLQNEFEFLKNKYKLRELQAGVWKFMRMRPTNFPSVRLWQFAMLIHKSSGMFNNPEKYNTIKKLAKAIQFQPEGYWKTHYSLGGAEQKEIGGIGMASVENILINSIAPFLFFYARQRGKDDYSSVEAYEGTAFETNAKTKPFTQCGLQFKNAGESQALIHLYDHYCSEKKCLKCGLAFVILNIKK